MEYTLLENGMPFEIVESPEVMTASSGMNSSDSESFSSEDEVEFLEEDSFMQNSVQSVNQSVESPIKQSGHFNCTVVGIGNYGCQNIDYISEKTNRCSFIKINADFTHQDDCFEYITLSEDKLGSSVDEKLKEELQSRLQKGFEQADIVIVVASLTDEFGEITPIICEQLNRIEKSNVVVLFKPTDHFQSDVDKANIILDKVKEAQQGEEAIKNSLVILSEKKASARYQIVTDRWEGLFATVYDITECLDTFLNPKNSAQISLSRVRKMLNCGGPTFYGRITTKIDENDQDGTLLDSLPESLREQSFVDDADLLRARNLVAIVKSSGEFSTIIEGQLKSQLGKIANANYSQSYQQQVVHLSHLYDENISEGEMEIIFLATGITGETNAMESGVDSEQEVLTGDVELETLTQEASEHREEAGMTPKMVAQPPSSVAQKKMEGLAPKSSKIMPLSLGKPPSANEENREDIPPILKNQYN